MPSVTLSTHWFVRVTAPHEFLKPKLLALKQEPAFIDCKTLIAYLHKGDKDENPHCHFLISLSTAIQQQSFSVRIKKYFNVTNKSEFSTKVWDKDPKALAYMTHEDTEPIVNTSYTQEQLAEAVAHNALIQKVIKQAGEKSSNRLLDKILEKVDENSTLIEISEQALELIYSGGVYHPGDFKLKSVIADAYIKTRSKAEWQALRSSAAYAISSDIQKYLL